MAKIQLDGALRDAVLNQVLYSIQDPNWVGVVSRWDEDNNLVWSDNSLANGQQVVPGGGAAHAEEVMIRKWTERLQQARIASPTIVEIFVTRSPCVDRSQARQFMGTFWPVGCMNKLRALINIESDVQDWRIAFLNYYQEGFVVDAKVYGSLALLNKMERVDIYWWRERHDGI
jgi:hypothetical protein